MKVLCPLFALFSSGEEDWVAKEPGRVGGRFYDMFFCIILNFNQVKILPPQFILYPNTTKDLVGK